MEVILNKEEGLTLVSTKISNNEEIEYKMIYNLDGTININLKNFIYINYDEDEEKDYYYEDEEKDYYDEDEEEDYI